MLTEDQQDSFYIWLGDRIKKARKNKQLSQLTLSEKLGISRVSIANIEKGKQKIQVQMLIELAYVLDISFEGLYQEAMKFMKIGSKIENQIKKEVSPDNIKSIEKIKEFISLSTGKQS